MRSNYNFNANRGGGGGGNPYPNELYDRNNNGSNNVSYYQNKLGPRLSTLLLSDDASNPNVLQRRLGIYSSFLLGTSIFFWSWAMYNTYHLRKGKSDGMALDLGIFSFFGTAFSSLLMLRLALGGSLLSCCRRRKQQPEEESEFYLVNAKKKSGDANHSPPGGCIRVFTVLTQFIVVANYLLGLLFAMTAGRQIYVYFATYCFIFSILWLLAAITSWILLGAYRESIRTTYGDEFVNKKSKSRFGCIALCSCILAYWVGRLQRGQQYHRAGVNEDDINEGDEEDELDEELRALYSGRGYSNTNY